MLLACLPCMSAAEVLADSFNFSSIQLVSLVCTVQVDTGARAAGFQDYWLRSSVLFSLLDGWLLLEAEATHTCQVKKEPGF
jgi:hypothetical protein